jgi:hypothetical protein
MTKMLTMAAAASSNVDGGRRDPTVVVVVVYNNNDKDSDCIIKAEQQGRTANLPNGGAVMTASVFLVLVLISVILSDVSIIVGIVGIVTLLHRHVVIIVDAGPHSLCCRHHPCLRHCGSRCCCRQRRRCNPQWLVVVSPTPLSAAQSVISCFRHRAIINTFAASRHPLSPTFTSRCPIHQICHSCRWWLLCSPPAQQHTN